MEETHVMTVSRLCSSAIMVGVMIPVRPRPINRVLLEIIKSKLSVYTLKA